MIYEVRLTDQTRAAILGQADFIASVRHAPMNAERWLERVWDAIDSLAEWPRRYALAPENDTRPYDIRKIAVGDYLLVFTVDDESSRVWVIGFRHGAMLPRPDDLPDDVPRE